MITYARKAGTTDVSVVIRIVDSTDGTPETAVTSATGGLALEYRREGATSTAITETDLTNLNDAHSDGGMKHIGNGYYRLDLPDAACASSSAGVLVHGTVTGMIVIGCYIQLVTYDPFDSVRLGLTSLPNDTYATAQAAEVDAIWDEVVDGTTTARQSVRLANAALGGKASGLGTTTAVYRDLADTKNRISATVDADGNRTAVTRDVT